jgi:hypothetical protein
LVLFWNDLNKNTIRHDKEQIATIKYRHRVVQRKFSDRVVWERMKQNSPIYNADTISTEKLSQATLTFIDGSQIEVFEKTMIQVFYTDSGATISLSGGGNIDIDTKNANMQEPIIYEKSENENFVLPNLAEGEYFWRITPYYTIGNVGLGDSTIVKNFVLKKQRDILPPVLRSPLSGTKVYTSEEDSKLNFIWQNQEQENCTLLVANNSDFENPIINKEVSENFYSEIINKELLKDGQWFWKVMRGQSSFF